MIINIKTYALYAVNSYPHILTTVAVFIVGNTTGYYKNVVTMKTYTHHNRNGNTYSESYILSMNSIINRVIASITAIKLNTWASSSLLLYVKKGYDKQ